MALTQLGKTWFSEKLVDGIIEPNQELPTDRYSNKTNIRLKNQDIVVRNMRISDIYIPVSDGDTVHTIDQGEHLRPDLVALRQYNNQGLAWVLLSANNMKNFFEFVQGKVIRIPEVTNLYSAGGVLNK